MGRLASLTLAIHLGLIAVLALVVAACHAQAGAGNAPAPGSGAANQPDTGVGNYSIIEKLVEPSAETHLLNPPLSLPVERASRLQPKDKLGELEVAQELSIAGFDKPKYVCVPAEPRDPRDHGCEAIDRISLTVRGPNTLQYHVQNHGAAVELKINILVHDIVPASRAGPKIVWHAGDVIFVSAAKATSTARIVSTVLVGEWNHQAIVFEVGKPLPAKAQPALEDLGVNQDLGDKVLFSYKVKAPPR